MQCLRSSSYAWVDDPKDGTAVIATWGHDNRTPRDVRGLVVASGRMLGMDGKGQRGWVKVFYANDQGRQPHTSLHIEGEISIRAECSAVGFGRPAFRAGVTGSTELELLSV